MSNSVNVTAMLVNDFQLHRNIIEGRCMLLTVGRYHLVNLSHKS